MTERLDAAYRFLRDLEHRIQLWDLRQTPRAPDDPQRREQLGRSLGMLTEPARQLEQRIGEVRSVVRDVHERLYFRPILDALVGSPSARLGMEQAALRLEALGFNDVAAAKRHWKTSRGSEPTVAGHAAGAPADARLAVADARSGSRAEAAPVLANTPDHAAW